MVDLGDDKETKPGGEREREKEHNRERREGEGGRGGGLCPWIEEAFTIVPSCSYSLYKL